MSGIGRYRTTMGGLVAAAVVSVLAAPPAAAVPGDLDPGFGSSGTVLTDLGGQQTAYGVVLQPDGKVVAAGYVNRSGNYDLMVARYTSRGAPDAAFGSGGTVTTDVSGSGSYDVGRAVALQRDGKIVVAGQSTAGPGIVLARYDRSGHPDSRFGRAGLVVTRIPGIAYAVAVRPDGRIVVTGSADQGRGRGNDVVVARFLSNGTPDPGFGTGGTVLTDVSGTGSNDVGSALALEPDGGVVVAGSSDDGSGSRFAVLRYRPDGQPDPSFGIGGRVVTGVGGPGRTSAAYGVVIRPDGSIVAGGASRAADGSSAFALAAYRPNGSPDSGFGTGGVTVTQVGGAGSYATASALALERDGRIVAAGSAGPVRAGDHAVARYLPNGLPDPTFGTGGSVVAPAGPADDRAFGVSVQRDGKIVTAGYSGQDVEVARYLP